MKKYFIVITLLGFHACISKDNLKPIVPGYVIHSNSSKIWLVDQLIEEDKNLAPKLNERKTTFTFFEDNTVFVQPLGKLGTHIGEKGSYSFNFEPNAQDTLLRIYLENKEHIKFQVKSITDKKMNLLFTADEVTQEWRLISYPKPF